MEEQYDPTAQRVHAEAPSEFEKVPVGQVDGFNNPDILQNVPIGQATQVALEADAK